MGRFPFRGVTQLTRLGIPGPLAQAQADHLGWHQTARLVQPGLQLGGQAATVHELLAGFPAEAAATDAELAVLIAADELAQGSLEAAERYLGLAARAIGDRYQPAGMSSCRFCSRWSGCCWPGSAAIRLRWPKRRGGCRR